MSRQSTLLFHDKKPGGMYSQGKDAYFRSVLGRMYKGVWVPYLYKANKKGVVEPTVMTPEETLKVLPQYGRFKK